VYHAPGRLTASSAPALSASGCRPKRGVWPRDALPLREIVYFEDEPGPEIAKLLTRDAADRGEYRQAAGANEESLKHARSRCLRRLRTAATEAATAVFARVRWRRARTFISKANAPVLSIRP
jgi:hypothetical protein